MDGSELVSVAVDEFGPFPAYVRPDVHWNGWECPRFPRESVESMIDAQAALIAAGGQEDELRWDSAEPVVLLKISDTYNAEGSYLYGPFGPGEQWRRGFNQNGSPMVERIAPDADGLYPVGAFEWCWSRCE